jgi:hypothetical protein
MVAMGQATCTRWVRKLERFTPATLAQHLVQWIWFVMLLHGLLQPPL